MSASLEFSRPIRVTHLPAAGLALRLEASPGECDALAIRLGLLALHGFWSELTLKPETAGGVRVVGVLNASVEQACVVSLEPVAQRVHEAFTLRILREGETPSEDPDAEDEMETLDGRAELGEVLAQLLALALDLYPRLDGAEMPEHDADGPSGPFAALSRLRPEKP